MPKVNIDAELDALTEHWSQRIIGEANGSQFKVAKGIGSTNWHKHDDQDELFIVQRGRLRIQLRDQDDVVLGPNEMFTVPRGMEHCPVADEEVHFVIVGLSVTSTPEGGKPKIGS